jgi:hypothetical protein
MDVDPRNENSKEAFARMLNRGRTICNSVENYVVARRKAANYAPSETQLLTQLEEDIAAFRTVANQYEKNEQNSHTTQPFNHAAVCRVLSRKYRELINTAFMHVVNIPSDNLP